MIFNNFFFKECMKGRSLIRSFQNQDIKNNVKILFLIPNDLFVKFKVTNIRFKAKQTTIIRKILFTNEYAFLHDMKIELKDHFQHA